MTPIIEQPTPTISSSQNNTESQQQQQLSVRQQQQRVGAMYSAYNKKSNTNATPSYKLVQQQQQPSAHPFRPTSALLPLAKKYKKAHSFNRQVMFDERDAAERLPKAVAAANRIARINSEVQAEAVVKDVNYSNIEELIRTADKALYDIKAKKKST